MEKYFVLSLVLCFIFLSLTTFGQSPDYDSYISDGIFRVSVLGGHEYIEKHEWLIFVTLGQPLTFLAFVLAGNIIRFRINLHLFEGGELSRPEYFFKLLIGFMYVWCYLVPVMFIILAI
ncbi:hypothetical protein R50073_45150 [Maricurvus nonylphenolicus]